MNTALANVIKASGSRLSDWNRMTKTSAVLRKLSLNAAKNWHQNSGANRLDSSSGGGMSPYYCKVPGWLRWPRRKKNQAAFRPPDRCVLWVRSEPNFLLVGFNGHCPKAET